MTDAELLDQLATDAESRLRTQSMGDEGLYRKLLRKLRDRLQGPRKARPAPDGVKVDGAVKDVQYELDMMALLAPMGVLHLDRDVISNMVIESFLVHYRNVRDFLFHDKRKPDDVLACDYSGAWPDNGLRLLWETTTGEYEAINKKLAHLTYTRPDREWDREEMYKKLRPQLERFFTLLPSSYATKLRLPPSP